MKKILHTIKKIILSICRNIGLLFIMIYGLICELLFKKSNNKIQNKKISKIKQEQKEKTNFKKESSEISDFEEPETRIVTDQVFVKEDSEINKIILKEYCNIFHVKEDNIEKQDKSIIKSIEKKIISDTKYEINHKKIDNDEKLIEFVNTKIIKEVDKLYNLDIKKVDIKKRREYLFNVQKNNKAIVEEKEKPIVISKNIEIKQDIFNKKNDEIKSENFIIDIDNSVKEVIKENLNKPIVIMDNSFKNEELLYENDELKIENVEDYNENYLEYESEENDKNILDSNLEELDNDIADDLKIPNTLDDVINENLDEIDIILNSNDILLEEVEKEVPNVIEKINEEQEKKEQDTKKDKNRKEKKFNLNLNSIIQKIKNVEIAKDKEIKKEELEDKEYESILGKIDKLLVEIASIKNKNLSKEDFEKLKIKENQLLKMKESINDERNHDIEQEEEQLNYTVIHDDIEIIENELEKINDDHKIDLNIYGLNEIEYLNSKDLKEANRIEKKLIITKIKKAKRSVKINNLLSTFFLKNKYLLYLTSGLAVSKNLSFIDSILKRRTINNEPDLSDIYKGSDALDRALELASNNLEHLEDIQKKAYFKHPELKTDIDFNNQLDGLKNSLIKRENRLNKKKKMIEKYNINLKVKKLQRKITNK